MAYGKLPISLLLAGASLACSFSTPARGAERARTTNHVDANFGQLNSLTDVSLAQTLCVFSSSPSGIYNVVALGSGTGGSFKLVSSSSTLDYHVQWASEPNRSSGVELQAGIASQQFSSIATQQSCNSGPPASATLILRLNGSETANAQAGAYTGVLLITIAPG
jgi:hypothetical protein